MLSHRVNQDVNQQEEVTIFWACLIQVGEVYTRPPLSADFLDHHHVCQPVEVVDLPNEILLL